MDDRWVRLRDDLCRYWLKSAQSKPQRELKMGWLEALREKWEGVPELVRGKLNEGLMNREVRILRRNCGW
jgi:hypothetical protein